MRLSQNGISVYKSYLNTFDKIHKGLILRTRASQLHLIFAAFRTQSIGTPMLIDLFINKGISRTTEGFLGLINTKFVAMFYRVWYLIIFLY